MARSLWIPVVLALAGHAGRLHAESPFDYFRNSWTVIGLKDYEDGTRVTPENELLLKGKQKLRISLGPNLQPLDRRQTKTLLDGWLPVVLLSAEVKGVRYDLRLWATPLPRVQNWREAFHWPTEGENYLNWIWAKATNVGREAVEGQLRAEKPGSTDSEPLSFRWKLSPGETAEAVMRIPFDAAERDSFEDADPQLWLDRTVQFWRDLMAQGARFEIPEAKANDALRASHVYQFINNDHGVVKGGEGFYDTFYIRDGAYEVQQFEEAGFLDVARKAMEAYLAAQRPDGRFETQRGQLDANGQAVWALWQFYQISGDGHWLERAYPAMVRAVEWTMAARRQAPADSPFAGVLPNAPADGEYLWDGKHHIVGYDFWNLRGMLCTAAAARALNKRDDAERFAKEAESYRGAIDAAWKRTGMPHFPPSWETGGTHWGNTETLWPTPIFPADDPRVLALDHEVRHHFGGGFQEGTIRWCPGTVRSAIHPYMSSYTTMASLVRGEHEQVVEDFYWYLLHSTATHAFPEGIYDRRRIAWNHTIPHATGASNYAFLLRHMLVHEQGDELHLLKAVPDGWLEEGKAIRVERAPTHFGQLAMQVRGTAQGVEVQLELPRRSPPRRVVLHLPSSRPLRGELANVEVRLRPPQKRRWDFATVVQLYEPMQPQPFPGLLPLPPEEPPQEDRCTLLDLRTMANTDPLTAPFAVPRPGRLVFAGLPTGRQVVAGVPFDIIDPARNQGRGFVVLQGGDIQGAASRFPQEIALPVNQRGKRVFFLGNVVGWSRGDIGTGDPPAVAEYVIHYEDGGQQRIPLILGRTCDDWVGAGNAEEVYVGMSGDPWHLNVIAAPLRAAAVTKIVFRDLGTASAPVLVAVTVEQ